MEEEEEGPHRQVVTAFMVEEAVEGGWRGRSRLEAPVFMEAPVVLEENLTLPQLQQLQEVHMVEVAGVEIPRSKPVLPVEMAQFV